MKLIPMASAVAHLFVKCWKRNLIGTSSTNSSQFPTFYGMLTIPKVMGKQPSVTEPSGSHPVRQSDAQPTLGKFVEDGTAVTVRSSHCRRDVEPLTCDRGAALPSAGSRDGGSEWTFSRCLLYAL
jgi:hypothetical protein